MLSSMIHQPCDITIHLLSEDIFIHPPPPNSELPGNDQTLRGVVEIKAPSERTIQGLKVTLQGIQTLAIPDANTGSSASNLRWEEKSIMDKAVEIMSDGEGGIVKHHRNKGKAKAKEKASYQASKLPPSYTTNAWEEPARQSMDFDGDFEEKKEDGIHLSKGVHGFEFSFIIPASSPPFERSKHGRVRYIVTATALGAGRARQNISAWREVFVILNVNKDGGPTPLEITYADVHEALGPLSISLTAASLTVGGTAVLTVVHPDPPAKLNVHVIRVFCEQTFEMYSELKKAWLKLPPEKLRIAEWGHMPNKSNRPLPPSQQPHSDPSDAIWIAEHDGGEGRPGKSALHGTPTLAPYGNTITHTSLASAPATPRFGPNGSPLHAGAPLSSPRGFLPAAPVPIGAGGGAHSPMHSQSPANKKGYKLKATVRLPNDDHMRPSTVRGSRAEIRVGHEMGVEVFFSREDVLDTREGTENFGKPKVQVFSARRAVVIPSCTATFDTVHLPPYVQESPVSSRPPSPSNLARSPPQFNAANHSHSDLQKLAYTLHTTLPGGRGRATPPSSKHTSNPSSNHNSAPGSHHASRDPSPTRPALERGASSHSIGHSISAAFGSHFPAGMGMGRKSRPNSRPNSRPASPTHERTDPFGSGVSSSPSTSTHHHPRGRRGFGSNLHALTPAVATQTMTAPASGTATPIHGTNGGGHHHAHNAHSHHHAAAPRTLPANAPWGYSHLPHRTGNSHDTCNCGRTTEELAAAENRLLDGQATAPFNDAAPPSWSESRAPSPDYFSQVWAGTQTAAHTPSKTPYGTP